MKNFYECGLDALRSYILKYGGAMTAFSMLIPASYVYESDQTQENGTGTKLFRLLWTILFSPFERPLTLLFIFVF